jgi:hypothetical protein
MSILYYFKMLTFMKATSPLILTLTGGFKGTQEKPQVTMRSLSETLIVASQVNSAN